MTDWGVHLMDIVQWGMGVEAPIAVDAMGGKYTLSDNRETPDTLMATFEYPKFVATYENRAFSGRGLDGKGYGILFVGSDASMLSIAVGLRFSLNTAGVDVTTYIQHVPPRLTWAFRALIHRTTIIARTLSTA
jgi:predicted dehydrogenase